jgi:hypothetical protein
MHGGLGIEGENAQRWKRSSMRIRTVSPPTGEDEELALGRIKISSTSLGESGS